MSKTDTKNIRLSQSGFIHARLAASDESDGSMRLVAGVLYRVRPIEIRNYLAGEPGVVLLWCSGMTEAVAIIGSVDELDKIMVRVNLSIVEDE